MQLEELLKAQARARQLSALKQNATVVQNSAQRNEISPSQEKTRDALADMAGISHDTIDKVKSIRDAAIPEVRDLAAD